MINIHTHIFNAKYTPEYFLADNVGSRKTAKTLRNLLTGNWLQRNTALALIKNLPGKKKFLSFIKIGIHKEQEEVFNVLRSLENNPANTRFVVLPINFKYMGAGDCEITYEQQLDDLLFKVKQKYPNTCLPFLYIDPRMESPGKPLVRFLKEQIERGFVGIKLYPSLGYFPYDPQLEESYQFAAENGLPIITHASRGGIYFLDDLKNHPQYYAATSFNPVQPCLLTYTSVNLSVPVFKEPKYNYPKNITKNDDFCDFFLDPENYMDALMRFPNLKLCFAHFGSDIEIDKKLGKGKYSGELPRNDTWYDKIVSILKNPSYPNVYTDISYTLHLPYFRQLILQEMENDFKHNQTTPLSSRLVSKVLYGTDFYMQYQEDNCTEASVYADAFRDFNDLSAFPYLSSLGPGKVWHMITEENNKNFLESTFYKP